MDMEIKCAYIGSSTYYEVYLPDDSGSSLILGSSFAVALSSSCLMVFFFCTSTDIIEAGH